MGDGAWNGGTKNWIGEGEGIVACPWGAEAMLVGKTKAMGVGADIWLTIGTWGAEACMVAG